MAISSASTASVSTARNSHDLALSNYLQVLCGKEVDSIYENANDSTDSRLSMVLLVFLRSLAICVRQEGFHSLDYLLVS